MTEDETRTNTYDLEPRFEPLSLPDFQSPSGPEECEKWVDSTGAGKICGNCHQLLSPSSSNRLAGVVGTITGQNPSTGMPVSGTDLPFPGYASKICPSCGVGNRHALIPAVPVPSTGYSSIHTTPSAYSVPQPYRSYINSDAPSGGYAFLGFLIPIVGLVLYLVWKDEYPLRAR